MSTFFIHRPIFATVLALVIVIAGLATLGVLPVAQYPEISPPTVKVTANYPGANALVVSETVAAPIEQEVNGVEGMIYMSSTSAGDGSYALTVTFELGTDMDMASVLVQNRVAIALPKLPDEVTRQGVTTKKQSTSIVLLVGLSSSEGTFTPLELSNYATRNIKDELARIKGVGEVVIFGGADYSMRVWLDPEQLKSRRLTTEDVVNAIREQNVQVAAGQIGEPPVPAGQNFQYTINTRGRLTEPAEFERMIVKTGADGRVTRVGDVARVELGAKTYAQESLLNGRPAVCLAVYQSPGSNSLDVAEHVRGKLDELREEFPADMEYSVPLDTTKFVSASIAEVVETLLVATLLVFLTIYVFLQDWRSTIVPALTIPVSLIGTFAVMALFGFSVNMLTLFGLVLAIGIVVDDAIVVVENTARHIADGMESRPAAIKAMREVTGPVIATTLVLLAVFVPASLLPGITGQLYRQFSLTIAAATVFSSINALTLSPALCAILLRPELEESRKNFFFRGFNRVFEFGTNVYGRLVRSMVRRTLIVMAAAALLAVATAWGFVRLPTGFLPTEDRGYLFATVQLPDASSLQRTDEVVAKLNEIFESTPGLADWVTVSGYSLLDGSSASNAATAFLTMKDWSDRDVDQYQLLRHLRDQFAGLPEAVVVAFPPPAIDGLGNAGGFQMQIEDRGGMGLSTLQAVAQEVIRTGNSQTGLTALNTTFRANTPQLFVDIDREKVKNKNVPLDSVFATLQAYLGSVYVNDFNKDGRTYQVRVQADHAFRVKPSDIESLDVRNLDGQMIPLGTFVAVRETFGPQILSRYQMYDTAAVNGEPARGFSSGEALRLMEQLAKTELPDGMAYEWTGMSYQEKAVGSSTIVAFALAVVLVFLVLAAQYESWTSPAAVICVVPLAVLGSVVAVAARQMDNNVYTQIGLVLLVALASKNAILIVEFASELREQGRSIREAAEEAALLRFRAILMTSFSFVLGTFPLVVAAGAGAASRQALGTAVFGGMIAATLFSVCLVPVFFVVFRRLGEFLSGGASERPESAAPEKKPAADGVEPLPEKV